VNSEKLNPNNRTTGGTGAPRLSVIVITKNEEANIVDCLDSVRWADEIIVVDSSSTDRTVSLAEQAGAVTYQIGWKGFGDAKQRALDYASSEWVLSLDADERVSAELAEEMRTILLSAECDGYEIPRLTNFVGRWIYHSGWRPDYVLRLFRKSKGAFTQALVHEGVVVSGRIGRLNHDLLHYSYRSVEDYLDRLNRYTTLAATEMRSAGKRFKIWQPLLKPPAIFVKRYVLKLGALDGWAGFQIAFLSAVYVFVKYAKLWHLSQKKQKNETPVVARTDKAEATRESHS
jgi:glycosyltransferase involved in cell wall biosynthesis